MWFLSRKKKTEQKVVEREATVEIEARKDAQKEAVLMAKDASKQLNKLLENNGFTLKIYLAAGGKHKEGE